MRPIARKLAENRAGVIGTRFDTLGKEISGGNTSMSTTINTKTSIFIPDTKEAARIVESLSLNWSGTVKIL